MNTWKINEFGQLGIEGVADISEEDLVRGMLLAIGEDSTREGLVDTPKRVVKAWREWFAGYDEDPIKYLEKEFEDGAPVEKGDDLDEMLILTNIPIHSHCEHHITPIIGVAHVAYIPQGRIVGISKFVRVVNAYMRRLQVQERLTHQVADAIDAALSPLGVGVVITAKHFCMSTRGVKTPEVATTTSALRGVFRTKPEVRAEFLSLIQTAAQLGR